MGDQVNRVTSGLADLEDSAKKNPTTQLLPEALSFANPLVGTSVLAGESPILLGKRIIQDKKQQAIGQADILQKQAADANAAAQNAAPKAIDPAVEERRRLAAIAATGGRDSTIRTSPNTLGNPDIARKMLLGY